MTSCASAGPAGIAAHRTMATTARRQSFHLVIHPPSFAIARIIALLMIGSPAVDCTERRVFRGDFRLVDRHLTKLPVARAERDPVACGNLDLEIALRVALGNPAGGGQPPVPHP